MSIADTESPVIAAVRPKKIINSDPIAICHRRWRAVLEQVECNLRKIDKRFTVCGPFGFELAWQSARAPTHIRKFYIYTNNPESEDKDKLAQLVQTYAINSIHQHYPEIFDDFVVFIKNNSLSLGRSAKYKCKDTDKLLDIQIRNTQKDILADYAEYIVLAYRTILSNTGEASDYKHSIVCRSRFFQLFFMLFQLYYDYLPATMRADLTGIEKKIIPHINNRIQVFFKNAWAEKLDISDREQDLIDTYVLPLCNFIDQLLESRGEEPTITINTSPYHLTSSVDLSVTVNEDLYNDLVYKVRSSYKNFIS